MNVEELAPAERTFIDWLGRALGRDAEGALELVLQAPEDANLITTRVREGRFESLSLRAIGPRLRWHREVGPLSLPLGALALEELDCHGLDLTELVPPSPLVRLDCSSNALQQLELSHCTALQSLNSSANDLMVLDLRHQHQLVTVDCSGNALSALILSDEAPVRTIKASRNQLMVFDIGPRPELHELRLDRNALVHLPLDAASLRVLSAQRNQLTRLELDRTPDLRSLDVSRNRLGSLSVARTRGLRVLHCGHNYLDSLDVSTLTGLEDLDATNNQLEHLTFTGNHALHHVALADNRLRSLRLGRSPSLEVLDVARNDLESIDLSELANLTDLTASHNHLSSFSCGATPHLVRLCLEGNPLLKLDLDDAPALTQVSVDGKPSLHAPETLIKRLPSLRRIAGLPVHDDIRDMDRFELHHLAVTYDAPDREEALFDIVQDTERCARGTALLVYWATHPGYYLQFEDREAVPPYARKGWDLLQTIESNVRSGAYLHDDVPFDPRDDRTLEPSGKDWTAVVRAGQGRIPAFMMRRTG